MRSSVGFVDMGGGGGGGTGKRGAALIGVGDGGVGTLGMEREAESWWDNVRVLSSDRKSVV